MISDCFVLLLIGASLVAAAPAPQSASATGPAQNQQQQTAPGAAAPTINWGNCPQLEPTDAEKRQKSGIIEQCLAKIPLPANITQSSVEAHRAAVAQCALESEGWFSPKGEYKYSKAETEIKNKGLDGAVEREILGQHSKCRSEATTKFGTQDVVISQIQLYQACMDYHISRVCGIQILVPAAATGQTGQAAADVGQGQRAPQRQ